MSEKRNPKYFVRNFEEAQSIIESRPEIGAQIEQFVYMTKFATVSDVANLLQSSGIGFTRDPYQVTRAICKGGYMLQQQVSDGVIALLDANGAMVRQEHNLKNNDSGLWSDEVVRRLKQLAKEHIYPEGHQYAGVPMYTKIADMLREETGNDGYSKEKCKRALQRTLRGTLTS